MITATLVGLVLPAFDSSLGETAAQRLGGHCHFWCPRSARLLRSHLPVESTSLTFGLAYSVLGPCFGRGDRIGHCSWRVC
jgi:hypothetical protein